MGMQCHVDLRDLVHRGVKTELVVVDHIMCARVTFPSGDRVDLPYGETLSFDCRTINHHLISDLCEHSIPFTCS